MSIAQTNSGTEVGHHSAQNPRNVISLSLFVAGCLQIAMGIGAIAAPAAGAFAIEMIVGFVMLFAGLSEAIFAWEFRSVSGTAWRVLRSVCFIATGGVLFAVPLSGIVTLALVIGVGFIFDGALRLSLPSRFDRNRTWLTVDGLIGIAAGVVIIAGWPTDSVFILGTLVGIRLLMAGCVILMVGVAMRRSHLQA